MSRVFKALVVLGVLVAALQTTPHLKSLVAKSIQTTPISSKILGPVKGLISAQELVEQREANLLFKGEAHEVRASPVLPEMYAKIKHPEPYVLHIPKARVYSDKGVVIAPLSDKALDDSAFESSAISGDTPVLKELSLGPLKPLTGRSVLISGACYRNYYQWMINILPKVALLQAKEIKTDRYLIPKSAPKFVKESLEMLGIRENIETLDTDSHYECDELIYPSMPCRHPTAYVPKWVCQWLRKTFHDSRKSGRVYAKHIIISRSKASGKHMLNEQELLTRLEPYGFVCVSLEDMTLEDQIGLFGQVEIVIASHGAGLTNLVFSNSGTKVIEIFPPQENYTPSYAIISQVLKLDHTPIFLDEADLRSSKEYSVNIEQIEQMVWCMMNDSGIDSEVEDASALWP